jgi:N-acetylglucosamine malate deacetylase 2
MSGSGTTARDGDLFDRLAADVRSALAVVAHPDDESFGLGAVLAALAARGVDVRVLCLTQGEASTLGATHGLGAVRGDELARAATALGVGHVCLIGHEDGHLADVDHTVLEAEVERELAGVQLMVVFEPGGVTGHPDHRAATAAAVTIAERAGLPVLEWGVAGHVAERLNDELGTSFVAFDGVGVADVAVDRHAQLEAIACHDSQARDNPVLARRLELQGPRERVRLSPVRMT